MNENPDNNLLLDATADHIYHIIASRDIEAYKKLTGLIATTIEAIAEQYVDMSASDLANFICTLIEHDEHEGGETQ